jgi:PAS domain S-box-containing protein
MNTKKRFPHDPDFRALFESAPGSYLVLLPDFTIVAASNAYLDATMVQRENILGRQLFDVFPDNPSDATATGSENLRASLNRVLADKVSDTMAVQKYDIRQPGGEFEQRFWSPRNSPVLNAEGEVIYIIHRAEDVTEFFRYHHAEDGLKTRTDDMAAEILQRAQELQATKELIHSNQIFLDSIVENIPNMVFVKDAKDLRFVLFNKAGESLLGYARADLLGKNDYDFFPKEQADFFVQKDRDVLNSGNLLDIPEEPLQTRHQGLRFLHTRKIPILDSSGKPLYLLGISDDITERKAQAENFRKLNEQLAQNVRELESVNRELESFSYSVSHDLRAPLRSIDGFSRIVMDDCAGKLGAESMGHLQRIRGATQRMGRLIDDMLELSRVTRVEMNRHPVDLSAMAGAILDDLKNSQPARRVNVTIQPNMTAVGDAQLLRVMLDNLLGNAWKFTSKKDDGRIEFGTNDGDIGERVYFVRDNGAGFDSNHAIKLFGAFQRLHGTDEFPGTGIGLATAQRIVRRHGGRIWAEGTVDKGATFYFTL